MRNITMNEGEKHMGTKIMYNHKAIEKKWRENWEKNPINVNDGKKPKYYSRFFRFLVVSLLFVIICLTESGSKSRRLLMRIQMRNVSKRAHTEGRDPFSPLLCNNGAH